MRFDSHTMKAILAKQRPWGVTVPNGWRVCRQVCISSDIVSYITEINMINVKICELQRLYNNINYCSQVIDLMIHRGVE